MTFKPDLSTQQNTPAPTSNLAENEATIVNQCQCRDAGWEKVLEYWLQQQAPWALRLCDRHLGNLADAEDAWQDIQIKVFKGIHRFEGRSHLRTWLGHIIKNHCCTLLRMRHSRALTESVQHSIRLMEQEREAEDLSDTVESVTQTLIAMNERDQKILYLRFYRDHSLNEISAALNISLSATKMRLYRALDAFANRYGEKSLQIR